MKVLEYIIDAEGNLVFPATLPNAEIDGITFGTFYNEVTLEFYNGITTGPTGIITPTGPVISGLTGTVTVQGRPTPNSAWSNIDNGTLNLATGGNRCSPYGMVSSLNLTTDSVTGCSYILIRLDRGA